MQKKAIILAAGKGTRMKSSKLKVVHHVAGKPIINYITDTIRSIGVDQTYLIVGYQESLVRQTVNDPSITCVIQKEQLGTGHAVMQVRPHIQSPSESTTVLIVAGDCPLIQEQTVHDLFALHETSKAVVTVLSTLMPDPGSYGRIIRDKSGAVLEIREAKDCSKEQLSIQEINTGVYCVQEKALFESLDHVTANNNQNEYYLTDIIHIIKGNGLRVEAHCTFDYRQAIGINSRQDIADVTAIIYQRTNEQLMKNGVTIISPSTTFIDESVQIEPDTIIHPFTTIQGTTQIGRDCIIGSHSVIINSTISDQSVVPPMSNIQQ